ncbi:hypothetical protein OUZ56_022111 [Daphnia magna]|uniref:Uncharacterized protein n=1 Tax=Daphnia magna TaxID=35525 RepID=A0ABR0AVC6_9CRUS|nr:hypothetical protein OUZ56_022111 [Daphnia magna]
MESLYLPSLMRICLICIDIYNLAVGIDCQTAIRLLTSSVREQMYNTTASLFQVIKRIAYRIKTSNISKNRPNLKTSGVSPPANLHLMELIMTRMRMAR